MSLVLSNPSFPSCLKALFQSEAYCQAVNMKMILHSHANKSHFHKKGIASESFWNYC